MALQDSDIFLIQGPEGANPGNSYQVQAKDLFSGTYDSYYVLVNEGSNSYKCKLSDLFSKAENRGGIDRILLVNRGDQSYKVTLTEILNKYGSFAAPGQREWNSNDGIDTTWRVPDGVRYISIICVGGGGGGGAAFFGGAGGGGGALAYHNTVKVSQGQILNIRAGAGGSETSADDGGVGGNGGQSWVYNMSTQKFLCYAGGGQGGKGTDLGTPQPPFLSFFPPGINGSNNVGWPGGSGGSPTTFPVEGQVGYRGGTGGRGGGDAYDEAGGGAAAGSYTGVGANGRDSDGNNNVITSGGGGNGGERRTRGSGQCGGGIGIQGRGANAGSATGAGGSGGSDGTNSSAGVYGAGGGGQSSDYTSSKSVAGARGAVRIIWPGDERQYPSTGTANQ